MLGSSGVGGGGVASKAMVSAAGRGGAVAGIPSWDISRRWLRVRSHGQGGRGQAQIAADVR